MTKSFEGGRGRRKKTAQTLCAVGMNLNKRKESKAGEKAGGRRRGVPTAPLMSFSCSEVDLGYNFHIKLVSEPPQPSGHPRAPLLRVLRCAAPGFSLFCPTFRAALPQVFGVSSSTAKGGGGSLHLGRPPDSGSFPAVYEDVGSLWPFAGAAVSRFYSSARDSPPPLPSCFFRLGFGMELREWGRGGRGSRLPVSTQFPTGSGILTGLEVSEGFQVFQCRFEDIRERSLYGGGGTKNDGKNKHLTKGINP